jgi:hypothetical protein
VSQSNDMAARWCAILVQLQVCNIGDDNMHIQVNLVSPISEG